MSFMRSLPWKRLLQICLLPHAAGFPAASKPRATLVPRATLEPHLADSQSEKAVRSRQVATGSGRARQDGLVPSGQKSSLTRRQPYSRPRKQSSPQDIRTWDEILAPKNSVGVLPLNLTGPGFHPRVAEYP